MLLPTGVGEPRQLTDDKLDHTRAAWLPDSKSIVFTAAESGHSSRTYLMDIQGGTPRALTPEGTAGTIVVPDGQHILVRDVKTRQLWLYPIAAGEPQKLGLGASSDEFMIGYAPDGKSLLVGARGVPVKIARMDLVTGQRQPGKKSPPPIPPECNPSPTSSSAKTASPTPTPPSACCQTCT